MTEICEDEMKWLDRCFKMAVSANSVILDLIISRLETIKLPDGGKPETALWRGNEFRNATQF